MKTSILAVIPARLGSRRFPGKPLSLIGGKSLLERLYLEISRVRLIDRVVIATDSEEIIKAVKEFGGETVKTSGRHKTGSDRTAEAAKKLGGEIIINIQADHLGVGYREYSRVLKAMLENRDIKYASFIKKIEEETTLFDPNRVKAIIDGQNNALWFSRYPLPYLQGVETDRLANYDFFYHVGVYFFRKAALAQYHRWRQSRHEKAESLEQLRILDNHKTIRLFQINNRVLSIDTPEDLKEAKKYIL
jgi:3-deoxy-manno-octulosonate cytidylyltransferase (CMP-KDO synthetase)